MLLRALPYPQPERLAQVVTRFDRRGNDEVGQTGATWELLRNHVATMDLATTSGGFGSIGVTLVLGDHAEYVKQQRVSAGFFRVLGVAPALGREINADEDRVNGPAAAVLTPRAVGAPVQRRRERGRPIDRAARRAAHHRRGHAATILERRRRRQRGRVDAGAAVPHVRRRLYGIIARLKPGVTWAHADAEIAAAGQPVMDDLYRGPENHARQHIIPLQAGETARVRQPILILWGAVAVVLLIGCVNIAGLLMARGVSRAPEIATRIALGGGRGVIVRQLLCESLVVAACGGIAGIARGYAGSRFFATLLENAFGVTGEIGLDVRVLAVTGAAALGTGVVFGLLPALQASRVNLRDTLVESGSASIAGAARSWPRRAMVVVEVALGVVLLVGAGLLIRTFEHLMSLRPGFDATNVVTATLLLQDARYQKADTVIRLFEQSVTKMRQAPGVENAAVCLTLPYERALNLGGRWVSAKPGAEAFGLINQTYVTPGYFDTLRIPLVGGRLFTDADTASAAPVMIVNQTFVRRYSPDEDPIGRQIAGRPLPITIIGVVGDIQQKAGFGNYGPVNTMPATYIPAAQTNDAFLKMVHTWFSPSWLVRARGSQQGIAAAMQRAVASIDPLLPFAKFRTFDEVRAEALATQRAQTFLLTALAVLALVLAAVGLYGLVASSVAERTRELGIRIALGATTRQAVVSAAAPGFAPAIGGVLIGVFVARLAATTLRYVVWGIAVTDPLTFALAAGTVLLVAAMASLVPALRIVQLSPIVSLRR